MKFLRPVHFVSFKTIFIFSTIHPSKSSSNICTWLEPCSCIFQLCFKQRIWIWIFLSIRRNLWLRKALHIKIMVHLFIHKYFAWGLYRYFLLNSDYNYLSLTISSFRCFSIYIFMKNSALYAFISIRGKYSRFNRKKLLLESINGPTKELSAVPGSPLWTISNHFRAISQTGSIPNPRKTCKKSWTYLYRWCTYASSKLFSYFTRGRSLGLNWFNFMNLAYWCLPYWIILTQEYGQVLRIVLLFLTLGI